MSVLASISAVCKVKDYKKLWKTVSKISLVASYKIWLARRSNDWAPCPALVIFPSDDVKKYVSII